MSLTPVSAGFLPLVDAAPVIIARELGFAAEEGLNLSLTRAPSWSALRDLLAFGSVDAAHMLSAVPVAASLGIGGIRMPIDALMMTSQGGEMLAVSRPVARRMRDAGYGFDFADVPAARAALGAERLRIGIPFALSLHVELLRRAFGDALDLRTVPPPQMAEALDAGEIDAFIVGEPWASMAVERGKAELLLPGTAIWRGAPEKVLAMRRDRAEGAPDLTARLMRAVWRSCRWLEHPANRLPASEILARHIDVPPEVIERIMAHRLVISPEGEERRAPQFLQFFDGCATFPWRSQAAWIGTRLAARHGLDIAAARDTAMSVFRTDLYRRNLGPAGADLPAASSRLEGAVTEPSLHPAAAGRVMLLPDPFFDGAVFDPDELPAPLSPHGPDRDR